MKQLFKEIYILLYSGKTIYESKVPLLEKVKNIFLIIIIATLIPSCFVLIRFYVFHKYSISIKESSLNELFQKTSFLYGITYICIIGPIMEELAFRIGLQFSRVNFSLMITFLFFYIFRELLSIYYSEHFEELLDFKNLILATSLGLLTFTVITKNKKIEFYLRELWKKYSFLIFWGSFIIFGGFHIFNFDLSKQIIYWLPLLILPQISSGIILGYTRLKYGITYSIMVHIIINTFASLNYF